MENYKGMKFRANLKPLSIFGQIDPRSSKSGDYSMIGNEECYDCGTFL